MIKNTRFLKKKRFWNYFVHIFGCPANETRTNNYFSHFLGSLVPFTYSQLPMGDGIIDNLCALSCKFSSARILLFIPSRKCFCWPSAILMLLRWLYLFNAVLDQISLFPTYQRFHFLVYSSNLYCPLCIVIRSVMCKLTNDINSEIRYWHIVISYTDNCANNIGAKYIENGHALQFIS